MGPESGGARQCPVSSWPVPSPWLTAGGLPRCAHLLGKEHANLCPLQRALIPFARPPPDDRIASRRPASELRHTEDYESWGDTNIQLITVFTGRGHSRPPVSMSLCRMLCASVAPCLVVVPSQPPPVGILNARAGRGETAELTRPSEGLLTGGTGTGTLSLTPRSQRGLCGGRAGRVRTAPRSLARSTSSCLDDTPRFMVSPKAQRTKTGARGVSVRDGVLFPPFSPTPPTWSHGCATSTRVAGRQAQPEGSRALTQQVWDVHTLHTPETGLAGQVLGGEPLTSSSLDVLRMSLVHLGALGHATPSMTTTGSLASAQPEGAERNLKHASGPLCP